MAQRDRLLPVHVVQGMGRLGLLARDVVEGFITGLHGSPYHGFSVEFAEHRKYVPGDAVRDLDWKVYARSDRYFIRRYKEETNCRCRVFLDASGSMDFGDGDAHKLDYGRRLAACLAYLALRQRDAAGLTICADGTSSDLPASAKPGHLGLLLDALEQSRSGGVSTLARRLTEHAERERRRGIVAVIGDLLDDETAAATALRHLAHRGHEVLLFHLLAPEEETLPYRHIGEFIDLETKARLRVDPQSLRKEYVARIQAFRQSIRQACGDAGVDYVPVRTDVPLAHLLPRYLARRAKV